MSAAAFFGTELRREAFWTIMVALVVPSKISRSLVARLARHATGAEFSEPKGEAALMPEYSVSWRVFKNPVALFVGGVAAVILELAEPRIRSGIWEHSSFRQDPVTRMARTGMAAMVTVYAARSVAERSIANVRRMHTRVQGQTPSGTAYRADDPELLNWVQATASFGFLEAYCTYVCRLSPKSCDEFYAEGAVASDLYGATAAPRNVAEQNALFEAMWSALEPSQVLFEFLDIVDRASLLPRPLHPLQGLLTKAAINIVPFDIRNLLGLDGRYALNDLERALVRAVGAATDRLILPHAPPAKACARLGLSHDYLYSR